MLRQELRRWEEDSYTSFHYDSVSCNQVAYHNSKEQILAQLRRGCEDTSKRSKDTATALPAVKLSNEGTVKPSREITVEALPRQESEYSLKRKRQAEGPVEAAKRVKLSEAEELSKVAEWVRKCSAEGKTRVRTQVQTALWRLYRLASP